MRSPIAVLKCAAVPFLASIVGFGAGLATAHPAFAESAFQLALRDTGKREYYCTATFELTAQTVVPYRDVNGYFYVFVGDQQVGRSKGTSFNFAGGNTSAEATFETPNAPCPDVDGYVFVVGACLQESGFADQAECAAAIDATAPVREVRAR
ncbi:MAG: hypothetical protein AAGL24_11735 [Pseudomonadota bacterium]